MFATRCCGQSSSNLRIGLIDAPARLLHPTILFRIAAAKLADTFTLTTTDRATTTVSVTAPITPSNTVATIDVGDKRAR